MEQRVFLNFLDRAEVEGVLKRPFKPGEGVVEVLLEGQGRALTFRLSELACIKFCGPAVKIVNAELGGGYEEVLTMNGETFRVQIPDRDKFTAGFFGFPEDGQGPYQSIFFTSHGIRLRQLQRPVGQILLENGVLRETDMNAALAEQDRLRRRRVGEILAEENNLPQGTIEATLQHPPAEGSLPKNARVGDILIAAGLVTREQVEKAVASQEQGKSKRIGDLLIERGLITEEQLMVALATKFRLPLVDLSAVEPQEEALAALSSGMAYRFKVLPLERDGNRLLIATSAPTDTTIADSLRFATGCHIDLVVAYAAAIDDALTRYYTPEGSVDSLLGQLDGEIATFEEDEAKEFGSEVSESDSQVINVVNRLLIEAHQEGVSDIHFEPGPGSAPLRIRHRIDGSCLVAHRIAGVFKRAVIARLKIMSNLDIAERRKPQSGKILLRVGRKLLEYRVEITPTVGGQEDAVLRVLSSSKPLPLDQLGFSSRNLNAFHDFLRKPYGLILCVGPTGSGKTTTLHSALAVINTPERKIWTVEDPVEITQSGLRQVPVHPRIGFGFAEALRSFLRADPDVIMVGEMRDVETAKIAIEASLTGHLVLSTLHTNSAPETLTRLIEMGMDPFSFSDAVLGVIAQRLARALCSHCRRPRPASRETWSDLIAAYGEERYHADGFPAWSPDAVLMLAEGCEKCDGKGYRGRVALHEVLVATAEIKHAIKRNLPLEEIRDLALDQGMRSLKMDGVAKVLAGQTDFDQVMKVCL
ncbi:ATPase, T2SS/T4P/T4SS family [Desulfuromonas carbonis]|uniref:GspE/PulE family protein n=1 Tax=Desulfuromonas sp. DDH964 TaxID=1823759 RepID=UPI00078D4507|nr:ATPase, T2SS/T4P/T4SS family [Desulfuromonas sp. DDH964]AMV72701.1 PilB/PulE/GspE family ATPase [Desulfuromonas sp. DDH964]